MRMKRTMVIAALAAILGGLCSVTAQAAVSVTDVKAVQRYPWNGMVDIDYTVVCDDANADVYVFPEGTDNDTGALLQLKTLTGEGANGAVKAGTHRMTWNAAKDMPNFHSSSFSVKMTAISGAAPYIVIDISGGTNVVSYPVRFSASGPNLDDDTCRTTELWLRLILPGTFIMGSPTTELGHDYGYSGNETQHEVTISKPYYLGVFEVTQKQWQLITGKTSMNSYNRDMCPMDGTAVSYTALRGTRLGARWPRDQQVDADSFFGVLRARTSLTLDLPTEAMWEYACRAGTTTALNSGKDLSNTKQCVEMDEVGRYAYNQADGKGGYTFGPTKVGSYRANGWGLYDMHGNKGEWCLDWWQENLGTSPVSDPRGPSSGQKRVARGYADYSDYDITQTKGHFAKDAATCRSAYRSWYSASKPDFSSGSAVNWGFRLCCFSAE